MPDESPRPEPNPIEGLVRGLFGGLDSASGLAWPIGLGSPEQRSTRWVDRYGRDLTAEAREGQLDPVVGRDNEVEQVLEVLSRRTKNNPVLIGDPGVGKTAIVEGIAQRIAAGQVPETLTGRRVIALDLAGMVAGSKYRGEFEERLQGVIEEVIAAGRTVVLFVDELHAAVGAGAAEGAMDAANMLKPALARGQLQVVGATTIEDYRRYIEKDPALERRFQPIVVDEPTVEQTIAILRGLRGRYEAHHRVRITDEATSAAAILSARYVTDRFLPDKAIDLIDRASARARLRAATPPNDGNDCDGDGDGEEPSRPGPAALPQVTAESIAEVVSRSTGIPVAQLTEAERHRLLHLEELLHQRVIGQDEAVEAVADAVRQGRAGLNHPNRPVGSFLFLGPTGVGKTELARALAEALFGEEDRLIRFDMSEYQDRHTITQLTGAPPGYIGYGDAGRLTEAVRRTPYTVLLFDEIEKAHPEVSNTLLQLLDAGRLTDAQGRTANFANSVVIMTSNIGAEQLLAASATGRLAAEWREPLMATVRRHFRPEFLNRIDDIVFFLGLSRAELREITKLLLEHTRQRLRAQDISLLVDEAAIDWLAERGYQPEFGARPLRRTIGRELDKLLSRTLLSGELRAGCQVTARVVDGQLELTVDEPATDE